MFTYYVCLLFPVNGTLGEGLSLTLSERKTLAEGWVRASRGRLQVIVHVGATCVRDSQELVRVGVAAHRNVEQMSVVLYLYRRYIKI
jgi:dihydrodipicolinate synthase/N-acetylneuraminate lyase